MTTKSMIRETDIAAAIIRWITPHVTKIRTEVYVTLPSHGQVCADIVWMTIDATGEWYGVIECKRRLDQELEDQSMRWLGFANQIQSARLLPKQPRRTQPRERRLGSAGIGHFTVDAHNLDTPEVFSEQGGTFNREADTRLLSAAFHSHSGSHDAEAGSSSAHRMTGERSMLVAIANYVGTGGSIKDINLKPEWRSVTAHRLRSLIDANREWSKLPLDYSGNGITNFFATGAGR